MAKRLRDVCKLRDLPWSEEKLRKLPPFEFENWAVIALGGIPNKTQVGDMGIDGRIFPVAATPTKTRARKEKTPRSDLHRDPPVQGEMQSSPPRV